MNKIEIALFCQGAYPKSVEKNGKITYRDKFGEGWNTCQRDIFDKARILDNWFKTISAKEYLIIKHYYDRDELHIDIDDDGEVSMSSTLEDNDWTDITLDRLKKIYG